MHNLDLAHATEIARRAAEAAASVAVPQFRSGVAAEVKPDRLGEPGPLAGVLHEPVEGATRDPRAASLETGWSIWRLEIGGTP
jgi:hypothetical protein